MPQTVVSPPDAAPCLTTASSPAEAPAHRPLLSQPAGRDPRVFTPGIVAPRDGHRIALHVAKANVYFLELLGATATPKPTIDPKALIRPIVCAGIDIESALCQEQPPIPFCK